MAVRRKICATAVVFLLMICICGLSACSGDGRMVTSEELFENGAWCWFADPRAKKNVNADLGIDLTYIGAIDYKGRIKVHQRNNITGEEYAVEITGTFEKDDHDNPTFTPLPDGRVVVFYMKHDTDGLLYYRVTDRTGDMKTLRGEKTFDVRSGTGGEANRGSYPSVFVLGDKPDTMYLFWRGAPNRWPTVTALSLPDENDAITATIGHKSLVAPGEAPGNANERPYAKYLSDGRSRVYMTFTYDHPQDHRVNPVYFAYFDINSYKLYAMDGVSLADIAEKPYYISKTAVGAEVVDSDNFVFNGISHECGWVWELALDGENPVVLYTKINSVDGNTKTEKNSHQYFYARWSGTAWKKAHIADGGGWFHQGGNYEMCYSGGMTLDKSNPNRVFASVPVDGVYEIEQIAMADDLTVSSRMLVTENSPKNNFRPYVISGADSSDRYYLLWVHGDYRDWKYKSIFNKGFPTSIRFATVLPDYA